MISRRLRHLALPLCLALFVSPAYGQKVSFEGVDRPIPWVQIRLGRFFQSNQWARLDELSKGALDVAIENNLPDLKTEAQWYRTLVAAQKGTAPETVFSELQKTIEYGYRSVQGIESADQLAVLKADATVAPKFMALVQELKKTVASESRSKFQTEVDQTIAKLKSLDPPSIGVQTIQKPDGSNAGAEGQPMIVVLSRTYHAGFRKQWPIVSRVAAAAGVTALALFYEDNAEDAFIQSQAAKFAKAAGVVEGSYALVDREGFKRIRAAFSDLHEKLQADAKTKTVFDLYFPFTFIVDGAGRPLFHASGNLGEDAIEYALEASVPEPEAEAEDQKQSAAEEKGDTGAQADQATPKNQSDGGQADGDQSAQPATGDKDDAPKTEDDNDTPKTDDNDTPKTEGDSEAQGVKGNGDEDQPSEDADSESDKSDDTESDELE